ncbi:uncharacterized protein LOC6043286 [Culex quinquefasciatus]|uniref:uncharacterized protein LOC6043286 n=1 Tax=Culex quinquefasciatus TaxID=7176 RepID=UPI0018E3C919|nr:uncharacterized protein LOC6043286 [Culex quinquefasciatus]
MWNAFGLAALVLLAQIELNFSRIALETSTVDFGGSTGNDYEKDYGCKISMNKDLNLKQPLFLVPGTKQFITPITNTTDLLFHQGEQLELFCTRGFGHTGDKSIVTTCDDANEFVHNGKIYNISQLVCKAPVYHVASRTEERCFNNARLVKVGFELDDRFLKLYEVCFDEETLGTHYVKHALYPWNVKHQSSKRPSFIQGDYFPDLKMSKLYSYDSQRDALARILGSPEHADTFLNKKKDIFLARGHLAARADFVYGSHQRATFWFLNVAPQWQKFNSFNWQRVETGVKDLIAQRGLEVTVYTGTYGILELPDANGDMQQIFLDFDPNNGGRVPVPKVFYKVLHDEWHDAGIALIGVNNPHATPEQIQQDYVFCEDVSDQIKWLKWKPENILGGYSYACDVNEFNAVTKHLPLGKVEKLLV